VAADNLFTSPTETIYNMPILTFDVQGTAGIDQYARVKWRRTTTPLEEGPWSNTLTLPFPKIVGSEIASLPDMYVHSSLVLGKSGPPYAGPDITFKVVMPVDGTWEGWHIKLKDAATGATTVVDANKNGTSIFSALPSLTAGNTTADGTTGFTSPGTFLKGDVISLDFDAVGTNPGTRLSLQLDFKFIVGLT
jgi:hypothetical protein